MGSTHVQRQQEYRRHRARIEAAESEGWEPACMTGEELASWRAKNRALQTGLRARVDRPCVDCTLGFALEQRAQGTCNGEPGGVEEDTAEDERFLAKAVVG